MKKYSLETIKKLPPMYFTNITGGEPFIRTDLKDIVRELQKNPIVSLSQQMVSLQIVL
jgi:moaA: molybdenum cofactor biosynthesis protein A